MCRWLVYSGPKIFLEDLIVKPSRSILVQSRFARENYVYGIPNIPDGAFPTNGDGFGIGWYGEREIPGLYRDLRPAWSDSNLLDLSAQVRSGMFMAHLRAAYNGVVQRTNSHPFRYQRWLFQHNGEISEFDKLKRTLQWAVDPELFTHIQGSTDSETCFYLALTLGLEQQPYEGMLAMVQMVEEARTKASIEDPFRLTCALSDGTTVYAVRYSSDQKSKTLYINKNREGLDEVFSADSETPGRGYILLSEPLDECPHSWEAIPESSFVTVRDDRVEVRDFRP